MTVVATNGCFDCLHAGHISLLKFAKEQGDKLVVLVNSDESIRRLKGDCRPVMPLRQRVDMLKACRYVDAVIAFHEDTPDETLSRLRPDILVKGDSPRGTNVPGAQHCGRVVLAPIFEDVSTTNLIAKISSLQDKKLRMGVVIGHYNQPDVLRLNIAAIREFAGNLPILISDDCSPGFGQTPHPGSAFQKTLDLSEEYPDVTVWPNVARIGHTGGDMAAIWKGIIWGHEMQFDVVFKLSQRFIFTSQGWATEAATSLLNSGNAIIGKHCVNHGWQIRTEAIGMKIQEWYRGDILSHLVPRQTQTACELVLWDDIRDRLGSRILLWDLLSTGRDIPSPHHLFRASSTAAQYEALAEQLGVKLQAPVPTCDSNLMPGYILG